MKIFAEKEPVFTPSSQTSLSTTNPNVLLNKKLGKYVITEC